MGHALCVILSHLDTYSLGCVFIITTQRKQQSLHPPSMRALKEKESEAQSGPVQGPDSSPGKTDVCGASVSGDKGCIQ